jgi:hypothetical protein
MGEGAAHDHKDLPTILCGRGGGTVTQGRIVRQAKGNFCDLLLGVSARMGCPLPSFGTSTKMLAELS